MQCMCCQHAVPACPEMSRDVQRCRRWPGQRLFHVALHGSVLIESGHSPLSGGYVHDMVPLGQTVVEHDSLSYLQAVGIWVIVKVGHPTGPEKI